MKKIVLSIAAVMAAAAFAPEASAVPVFARQTGMACSACHFQHFPLLNGFGRAFKSSAFTMMGAQGKIEGEHLSIPDTLNMSILATAYKQAESGNNAGKWGTPGNGGELSLFAGGRISEFAGFLTELGFIATGTLNAAKMPILFEVAEGTRAGLVAYTTDGQGAGYSFETMNTGAAGGVHRLMGNAGPTRQHGQAASAAMYLGGGRTNATGLAFVVNNDSGFLNVSKFDLLSPSQNAAQNGAATQLPVTYVRAAGFMDVAGWDMGAGIQNWSGVSQQNAIGLAATSEVKSTVIDFQAQGEMGGFPVGFYASYGTSPASVLGNSLNGGVVNYNAKKVLGTPAVATTSRASSFHVAADFGIIPGLATLQLAMRQGTLGDTAVATALGQTGRKDNAIMVGVTYELAQNMELSAHYTTQSGSAWNAPVGGAIPAGKNASTILLETMF